MENWRTLNKTRTLYKRFETNPCMYYTTDTVWLPAFWNSKNQIMAYQHYDGIPNNLINKIKLLYFKSVFIHCLWKSVFSHSKNTIYDVLKLLFSFTTQFIVIEFADQLFAIQTSLFFWIKEHFTEDLKQIREQYWTCMHCTLADTVWQPACWLCSKPL